MGLTYLAGWGGDEAPASSITGLSAEIDSMPTTSDAFKSSPDRDDFYVIILSDSLKDIVYGSYIGNTIGLGDHVDGGTSRFSKEGVIYQAVCACEDDNNFPTTATAISSRVQSGDCNMLLFRFDLDEFSADFDLLNDMGGDGSIGCSAPHTVTFEDKSRGGITYTWDFGDGNTSTLIGLSFTHLHSTWHLSSKINHNKPW